MSGLQKDWFVKPTYIKVNLHEWIQKNVSSWIIKEGFQSFPIFISIVKNIHQSKRKSDRNPLKLFLKGNSSKKKLCEIFLTKLFKVTFFHKGKIINNCRTVHVYNLSRIIFNDITIHNHIFILLAAQVLA